jgi:hypothetical protein
VKPRARKTIEANKSLRLKAAISAQPTPSVGWDKNGMVLETGNKYSIYNDGDFYYLEVHHVSPADDGFYNCLATNVHGMAVVSCQVDVIAVAAAAAGDAAPSSSHHRRKEARAPQFIEVLPGKLEVIE